MTDEPPIEPPLLRPPASQPSLLVLLLTLGAGVVVGAALTSLAWFLSVRSHRDRAELESIAAESTAAGIHPTAGLEPSPAAGTARTPGLAPASAPSVSPETTPAPARQGAVLASLLQIGADDFVIDVYLNGQRLPDADRHMTAEVYGATGERVSAIVREGDWLVFNVVNNRLRWGGAHYFAVAGIADDGAVAFVSEESQQWSVCEDAGQAPKFIADRDFLTKQPARAIENPWTGGDKMMAKQVPGWSGQAIWGSPTNRNIWLKFTAPPAK